VLYISYDGTGVPTAPWETEGRRGKQPDGSAKTREVKRKHPKNEESEKEALREINYFRKNKKRMRYARFRAQGFFVGSGVVEAGCKSIIAQRLKRSGMEWTLRGANAIIALRCMIKSNRFEDYWCNRAA
jgi:hypothetical protein